MGTGILSSAIGVFIVLVIGCLYSVLFGNTYTRKWRLKVWIWVSLVYIISTLIVSQSFDTNNFFMLSDPSNYIQNAYNSLSYDKNVKDILYRCYFELGDNNGLYNLFIGYVAAFYNLSLDGVNSFSISLVSTLFGILSAITLFRVLANSFPVRKAYQYTLLFSMLSLFHFYSLVVVRDIVIAFFYLLCFEIIQKKFSTKGLLLLFLIMLLTWGVRLYSGLFVFSFILYYIYKSVSHTGAKYLILPLVAGLVIYIVVSAFFVVEQSVEEINQYGEDTIERGGGLVMKLLTLPPVIKQIVMLFYTQIAPFPPTGPLLISESFSQLYMSILVIIYEFWWFLIAYSMFYVLLWKGDIKRIDALDVILLSIAATLIIATSAHPDIRRMMPVYPIIYYEYLKFRNKPFGEVRFKKLRKNLAIVYWGLLIIYSFMKF